MTDRPNPVDVHVGQRLRLRRSLMGMSQERLGEALGLTFQQIQKYERGANRIGSSRLYAISRALEVPVAWFFEEMDGATRGTGTAHGPGLAEPAADFLMDGDPAAAEPALVDRRETLELVRAFNRIQSPSIRRRIFDLTKAIAAMGDTGVPPDDGAA
jgi:transcriptional regulator with XRE-family HTH domain